MKNWIISVASVVIITAIISMIVPDSKMGKYVRGIFSFFVMLVIIQPIFTNKISLINFSTANDNEIYIQENYVDFVIKKRIESYESDCVIIAKKCGIENAKIEVDYSIDQNGQICINNVNLNLKDSVIISDKEHIVILKETKSAIAKYLGIDENKVKCI